MTDPNGGWATKRAAEIKAAREKKQTEQENFNKTQDFLSAHAPAFWRETKEAIKAEVEKFNLAMGEPAMTYQQLGFPDNAVTITASGPNSAAVRFDEGTFQIQASGVPNFAFVPSIENREGKWELVYRNAQAPSPEITPKTIATLVVEIFSRAIE